MYRYLQIRSSDAHRFSAPSIKEVESTEKGCACRRERYLRLPPTDQSAHFQERSQCQQLLRHPNQVHACRQRFTSFSSRSQVLENLDFLRPPAPAWLQGARSSCLQVAGPLSGACCSGTHPVTYPSPPPSPDRLSALHVCR